MEVATATSSGLQTPHRLTAFIKAHDVIYPLQAEEVRRVADSELGFQQVALSKPAQAKTFLFVNTERMVVGCLVAEHIRQVKTETLHICYGMIRFSDLMDICGFDLFRLTESWSYQTNRKT